MERVEMRVSEFREHIIKEMEKKGEGKRKRRKFKEYVKEMGDRAFDEYLINGKKVMIRG